MAEEHLIPEGAALSSVPTLGRDKEHATDKGHTMDMKINAETLSLEKETNPWEAQAARFDEAARRLKLDDGIWKVMRYPTR